MNLDKQNIKTITKIVFSAIILYCVLQNIGLVLSIFRGAFNILYPFIIGAGLAFILNLPMSFYEKKLFKQKITKNKGVSKGKFKRAISIILSVITVVIILTIIFSIVIPELVTTIKLLIANVPNYINAIEDLAEEVTDKYPDLNDTIGNIKIDEEKLKTSLINLTNNVATFSINTVKGLLGGLFNAIVSIIFAIFILSNKEKLEMQGKKLVCANFKEEKAHKIVKISRLSKQTLKGFVGGQLIEAVIIGVLCILGMLILKIPYAVTIGVLIAFTALIPIVGAFIGGFAGALLIVTVNPAKALIFVIFLAILQQLEGNLIYPKVVGKSTGLPGMWVLFAVTVGGSLFGMMGMLLGVPVVSVLYTMIEENTNEKIKEKNIDVESI